MADIFDTLVSEKDDVFDEIASERDIFDIISEELV